MGLRTALGSAVAASFVFGACLTAAAQEVATEFRFPTDAYEASVSQRFGAKNSRYAGKHHMGDDVTGIAGITSALSVATGKVMLARSWESCPNWGHVVVIEHLLGDGRRVNSVYGHLDPATILVREGESVPIGRQIGKVGAWVYPADQQPCWGDHLHFAIRAGQFGAPQGVYPSWLLGYLKRSDLPGTYCEPAHFIRTHECLGFAPPFIEDDFNGNFLDPERWLPFVMPATGGSLAVRNRRLEISLNAGAANVGVASRCFVGGNFDVQADFDLLTWPANNRQAIKFAPQDVGQGTLGLLGVQRFNSDITGDGYNFVIGDTTVGFRPATTFRGKFRLTRTGTTLTGWVDEGSGFVEVASTTVPTTPTRIVLNAGAFEPSASAITMAWDNVKVNAGEVTCPPIANEVVVLDTLRGTSTTASFCCIGQTLGMSGTSFSQTSFVGPLFQLTEPMTISEIGAFLTLGLTAQGAWVDPNPPAVLEIRRALIADASGRRYPDPGPPVARYTLSHDDAASTVRFESTRPMLTLQPGEYFAVFGAQDTKQGMLPGIIGDGQTTHAQFGTVLRGFVPDPGPGTNPAAQMGVRIKGLRLPSPIANTPSVVVASRSIAPSTLRPVQSNVRLGATSTLTVQAVALKLRLSSADVAPGNVISVTLVGTTGEGGIGHFTHTVQPNELDVVSEIVFIGRVTVGDFFIDPFIGIPGGFVRNQIFGTVADSYGGNNSCVTMSNTYPACDNGVVSGLSDLWFRIYAE